MWAALLLAATIVAGGPSPAANTVTAIQIHGNTATPDDEVKRLAGVAVGAPFDEGMLEQIAARLKATRRFERVEVLKRFLSIADLSQVLLVIIVDEGPVKIETSDDPARLARVVRSRPLGLMFMPVLGREDGYGVSYGVQIARPDVAGKDSRLSFPLTWGGDKKAGVELEKRVAHAPVDRLVGGAAVSRRENPFFLQDDDRRRVWVRAERELIRALRIGATGAIERVSFINAADRLSRAGADVVVDTRVDPALPRNAIYSKLSWERLNFGQNEHAAHVVVDLRGYLGVFRQNVVAVRALRDAADAPLPAYQQPLLGGMANLRGFRPGTAVGDNLVAYSAELVSPLTSPLHVGRIGVSAFIDRGVVYSARARLRDQIMREGYGGSVWFAAAFLHLNIAVAHGRGSSTRVHVGGNVSF